MDTSLLSKVKQEKAVPLTLKKVLSKKKTQTKQKKAVFSKISENFSMNHTENNSVSGAYILLEVFASGIEGY